MIFRYRKEGQFDEFSYVQWRNEDAIGYQETIYIKQPIGNSEQLPFAWLYEDDDIKWCSFDKDHLPNDAIPLYTHPQKELTDEELKHFTLKFFNIDLDAELSDDFWIKIEELIIFAKRLNGIRVEK